MMASPRIFERLANSYFARTSLNSGRMRKRPGGIGIIRSFLYLGCQLLLSGHHAWNQLLYSYHYHLIFDFLHMLPTLVRIQLLTNHGWFLFDSTEMGLKPKDPRIHQFFETKHTKTKPCHRQCVDLFPMPGPRKAEV